MNTIGVPSRNLFKVDNSTWAGVELAASGPPPPAFSRHLDRHTVLQNSPSNGLAADWLENASVLRLVSVLVVWLLLATGTASAQKWANDMFNTLSHDFGAVARGAKTQYRFQVKNIYEEDAH